MLERRADAAFAALKAIIDGAVEEVDSAFCGGDDRSGVGFIGHFVGLPEVRPEAQRGEQHSLGFPEMAGGRARGKPLGVAPGSFFRGGFGHDAPSGGGWGPGAGFFAGSLSPRASKREQARRILR